MRLSEYASSIGGEVKNIVEDFEIQGVSTLEDAGSSQLSFVTDKKYFSRLAETRAGAVLVPDSAPEASVPTIVVKDVWAAVLKLLQVTYPNHMRHEYTGVHASAIVDPSASVGDDVHIGPLAVVGAGVVIGAGSYLGPGCVLGAGAILGSNCTLYAHVVLEAGTVLGDGVSIQPGAVLGADGFKYEILNGRWEKIPQIGTVTIRDNVEIGANSCVDRASYTETVIGENTKLDNLVQVAHNARIGSNCILVSQSGVAGSTTVGDYTILAAQAGIADNLTVGKGVIVMGQSGLKDNATDGQKVLGSPARPFRDMARIISAENRLPDMLAEFKRLTKRVEELERRLAEKE